MRVNAFEGEALRPCRTRRALTMVGRMSPRELVARRIREPRVGEVNKKGADEACCGSFSRFDCDTSEERPSSLIFRSRPKHYLPQQCIV